MRIGIAYNLKREFSSFLGSALPEDAAEEFDTPETIDAIREALESGHHQVILLGGDLKVKERIEAERIEFVFNLAEGFQGRNREAHLPALFEMMGIPYSGSDPLGLAATLDKSITKHLARSLGIRTPDFWIVEKREEVENLPPRFPFFVKPLWQGSSKGIRLSSLVENQASLQKEITRLFENYPGEPVLVEAYIPGRELTVGVLGNRPPEILGVMEVVPRNGANRNFYYSLEVKRNWKDVVDYHWPARLKPGLEEEIREAGLKLFEALRLRDVARFDFRVSPEGEPYFLEVNPLPGLSPESGDLVILARKKGWRYEDLILKIFESARSRYPNLSYVPST